MYKKSGKSTKLAVRKIKQCRQILVPFSPLSSNIWEARIFLKLIRYITLLSIRVPLKLKKIYSADFEANKRDIFDPFRSCCSNLAINRLIQIIKTYEADFSNLYWNIYGHIWAAGPKCVKNDPKDKGVVFRPVCSNFRKTNIFLWVAFLRCVANIFPFTDLKCVTFYKKLRNGSLDKAVADGRKNRQTCFHRSFRWRQTDNSYSSKHWSNTL